MTERAGLGLSPEEAASITFYKGEGCDTCGDSGYKGRAGLYEVMGRSPAVM